MPKKKVGNVRLSSPKQAEASRANGSKSTGPKSTTGKSKVAQNATSDGLFSRQVVIDHLGEKQEDFEGIKQRMWDVLRPTNSLEEMLVQDFTENWWRRERIRRAETAELRTRAGVLTSRARLHNEDDLKRLRLRFKQLYLEYLGSAQPTNATEIMTELEEVRQQLVGTASGVGFVLDEVKYVARKVKELGTLSVENEILFQACCGFGSQMATIAGDLNAAVKKQAQQRSETDRPKSVNLSDVLSSEESQVLQMWRGLNKAREDQRRSRQGATKEPGPAKPPEAENTGATEGAGTTDKNQEDKARVEWLPMLTMTIEIVIGELNRRKQLLEAIEREEGKTAVSMTVVDRDISDRFARAETAVERRMYRALAALAAMRAIPGSNILPQ